MAGSRGRRKTGSVVKDGSGTKLNPTANFALVESNSDSENDSNDTNTSLPVQEYNENVSISTLPTPTPNPTPTPTPTPPPLPVFESEDLTKLGVYFTQLFDFKVGNLNHNFYQKSEIDVKLTAQDEKINNLESTNKSLLNRIRQLECSANGKE